MTVVAVRGASGMVKEDTKRVGKEGTEHLSRGDSLTKGELHAISLGMCT